MRFKYFSPKQLSALTWWCRGSPEEGRDAVICDGAVRSGKTLCLSLSFVLWAESRFRGQTFAICAKTIQSLRRNLAGPLLEILSGLGFCCRQSVSGNYIEIGRGDAVNRFYLFGGKDEGSAGLIQGITLAGVLLDEVALMPRSFVEQALARCSVEGSRFWFNCNPGHPGHWFYTEWILKAEEKNALYLHFTMEDNPSLSQRMKNRYHSLYQGVFYERFVLGRWVAAHGAVYPAFSRQGHVVGKSPPCNRYVISCDYGTVNPASFGLWGHRDGVWYRLREFYHDSRREGAQKTDEEYADSLEELAGELPVERVLVDPSAASFIWCLRRRGRFLVEPARNQVLNGIRLVGDALREKKILFHQSCADTIREFGLYRWDLEAGADRPVKENDHAMDDIRYFVSWAFGGPEGEQSFFALSVNRAREDDRKEE